MSIEVGSQYVITATFRNNAGTLVNPTTVTARVRTPAGVSSSVTPVNTSTGVYTVTGTASAAGQWKATVTGSGNGVERVESVSFAVQATGA